MPSRKASRKGRPQSKAGSLTTAPAPTGKSNAAAAAAKVARTPAQFEQSVRSYFERPASKRLHGKDKRSTTDQQHPLAASGLSVEQAKEVFSTALQKSELLSTQWGDDEDSADEAMYDGDEDRYVHPSNPPCVSFHREHHNNSHCYPLDFASL
jgi:hypothetical protein